jgi:hypothetical protein
MPVHPASLAHPSLFLYLPARRLRRSNRKIRSKVKSLALRRGSDFLLIS